MLDHGDMMDNEDGPSAFDDVASTLDDHNNEDGPNNEEDPDTSNEEEPALRLSRLRRRRREERHIVNRAIRACRSGSPTRCKSAFVHA